MTPGASKPSSVVRSQGTGDVVYATDDFLVATLEEHLDRGLGDPGDARAGDRDG